MCSEAELAERAFFGDRQRVAGEMQFKGIATFRLDLLNVLCFAGRELGLEGQLSGARAERPMLSVKRESVDSDPLAPTSVT